MSKENKYTFSHFFGSYRYICILLTIGAIGLNSCSNQSSVRSSYLARAKKVSITSVDKKIENQTEQTIDNKHLKLLNEESIQQNQDFASNSTEVKNPTLIPLDRQLDEIKKDQASMKEDINDLQNSLNDMHKTLQDLKDAVQYYVHNEKKTPVTGGEMKHESESTAKNEYILESDEKLVDNKNKAKQQSKSTRKTKSYSKPKISKDIPKKENVVKEVEIIHEENTSNNSDDHKFNEALKKYAERDYNEAVKLLSELASNAASEDKRISCHYWMGEALFGMKNYDEAAKNFSMVANHNSSPRSDDAQIMVAESLMRSGKKEEAKMAFQQFISAYPSSEYMPRARKMLQQL